MKYDKLTDPITDITTLTEALLSGAFGNMGGDQREGIKDIYNAAWGLYTLFHDIITNIGLEHVAKRGYLRDRFIELTDPLLDRSQNLLDGVDGPLSEEHVISLEFIQDIGFSLRRHTDTLWLYSQLYNNLLPVRNEMFTLSDALDDLILPRPERDVAYDLMLDSGQARMMGDTALLLQAIEGLVANAVQFLGEGRQVALYSRVAADNRLELRVIDEGIGIARQHQQRIFEPFYQVVDRAEHLGLGLTIAKGLLECQGGTLSLDSDVGLGATFTVLLPLASAED